MQCDECGDREIDPKRLLCMHTVCIRCAQLRLNAAQCKGDGPILQCPVVECLKHTTVPGGVAASLPTNLLWRKLQELYKEYPLFKTGNMKCAFCPHDTDLENMKYCQHCHKYICVWCEPEHTKNEIFKSHHIDNIIQICCKQHRQVSEYLCVKCDKFLCVVCVHNRTDTCSSHFDCITEMKILEEEKIKDIQEYQKQMKQIIGFLDKEVRSHLHNTQLKLQKAKDIKSAVQQHVKRLVVKMPEKEKAVKAKQTELMLSIEEWVKPFEDREKRLTSCLAVDEPLLKELCECGDEGMKGGIELVIITASLIKSSMPSNQNICSDGSSDTDIRFIPMDSIDVGRLHIDKIDLPTICDKFLAEDKTKSSELGLTTSVNTTSIGQPDTLPVDLRIKPAQKWYTRGLKGGSDVVFTPAGHIAVCDYGNNNVVLYGGEGKVIITTMMEDKPHGIAYDFFESALIISNAAGHLTWVDGLNLSRKKRVRLDGGGSAWGVGVLSSGMLVVGRGVYPHPQMVGLYDREGRKMREITHYGENDTTLPEVNCPKYITVLPEDTIVVAMKDKVVYLSSTLHCLQIVDVCSPLGLTLTPQWRDILVVSRFPRHCIHHLCGSVGQLQFNAVMFFSDEAVKKYGEVKSISMMNNQLAVLFTKALCLYHWIDPTTTACPEYSPTKNCLIS